MLIIENLKQDLESCLPQLEELFNVLDIEKNTQRIEMLHAQSSAPDFWNDTEKSNEVMKELRGLENIANRHKSLTQKYEDAKTLIEMYVEENDQELLEEISSEINTMKQQIDEITLSTLLTGEYDKNNAIIGFHAGAGGTEAQDWAEMLLRMYSKWCDKRGFKASILSIIDGNDAGIKSASVLVEGENAYGYLRGEAGIHRLVRISPFDSSGSRHTSFAAVDVMPEIDDTIEIDIRPEDLQVDTYRASGAGGQHINKTDSAVRITHIPTGVVCACQTQRSQFQNRDYAMKMLKSKLVEIKEREHLEKIEDIKGVQKEIAWGAQIRSYVFMPYTLVKDHRTGCENGNVEAVMDGDLDAFINAYLKEGSHK